MPRPAALVQIANSGKAAIRVVFSIVLSASARTFGDISRLAQVASRLNVQAYQLFGLTEDNLFRPAPGLTTMRAKVTALSIAGLLVGAALPAMAELGPCRRDARETPLCGSGKGAARVVRDTVSPDKKFALAWRDPDKDPGDVTEDDADLELLLIRLADGVVLAKADTDYFRNPGVAANRREEFAIWSPDSRMVIRKLDVRYGTGEFTLYRIGPDGALAGDIDLTRLLSPPCARGSGRSVGTPRPTGS